MAHVVILGGGFGGLAAANELRRLLPEGDRITVVDRNDRFYMGFAKLWDLAGSRPLADGTRSLSALRSKGVDFVQDSIEGFDPASRTVTTTGATLEADAVVVALGAGPHPAHRAMLAGEGAHDLYDGAALPSMRADLGSIESGRIAVAILGGPFKCPPAPYEAALLIDEHLRGRGVRDAVEITVVTPQPITLPAAGPDASRYVAGFLDERGIELRSQAKVTGVDGADGGRRRLAIEGGEPVPCDLLFGVPATAPPELLEQAGLAGPSGFVHPDRHTLETSFAGVYAIGDCTTIPTANGALPKAGVFAAGQGEVAARCIAASLGHGAPAAFDGHGYCFLEVPGNKVAFVEGDFYADPPDVTLTEADEEQLRRKQSYERERLDAWLG